MKHPIIILFLAICSFAHAQTAVLTTDPSLPIPKLSFDEKGDLKITASATSSPSDFDFLVGKWKMHNRRSTRGSKTARIGLNSICSMRIGKFSVALLIRIFIPPLKCPGRRANVSKASRYGSLIPRPGCGACTGLPATQVSWTRLW